MDQKAATPRTVIIVQARMGSTRLPNKVLKEVEEKPLLGYLLERLGRVKEADQVVVATTNDPLDDEIVEYCNLIGTEVERGSEEDVLHRYVITAKSFDADVVVRISGDCPLIDPEVVDRVIAFYKEHAGEYDYVSNVLERTYPRGMDVEVFPLAALKKAAKASLDADEKEHVTLYFTRHPELFRLANVKSEESLPADLRLTVDTIEDFKLISHLLQALYPAKAEFLLKDVVNALEKHPEWAAINAHIPQKTVEK